VSTHQNGGKIPEEKRSQMMSVKSSGKEKSSKNAIQYRIGAHVRLSPSDEIRDEGSLVSHPQRINSFVDFKNVQQPGWGEIVEWYIDKDMSGKDMNRPAFRKLPQDIKRGHVNAVVVTELSRLSRNVKDFCQFWDFLKAHRATFLSLKENFDTSTPIGELMVIQCIGFAQFERKTIVARIKDGAKARAERGLASGGQRLLGLDRDPHRRCHLLVNEKEVVVVRRLFEKFVELGSIAKLQAYLNENGYRTKSYVSQEGRQIGGKLWTHTSLHKLLINQALIGKREINKSNRNAPAEDVPESEHYRVVPAAWPAILDEKLFRTVQEKLKSNRNFAKPHKHIYRLTGLIRCGACGEILGGKSATGRHGKFYYYAHNRKFTTKGDSHSLRCPLERLPAVNLEEAVIGRLSQISSNKKLLKELVATSQEKNLKSHAQIDQLLAQKEQDRRRIERLIDNLTSLLAEQPEGLSIKSILDKVRDYEHQLEQVNTAMADLRKERNVTDSGLIDMEQVFLLFRAFGREFPRRPAQEHRDLLREVVRHIRVEADGVHLQYYASPVEILLGLGDWDGADEPIEGKKGSSASPDPLWTSVRLASRFVEVGGIERPSAFSKLLMNSSRGWFCRRETSEIP
jgi:site-specific DNA recombinase